MKLAEALSLRAELKSKINALGLRIRESAKIQEGDEPVEDVDELRKELDDCLNQIEDLIYRINMTNVHATIDGESLTRLIARRDVPVQACGHHGEYRQSDRLQRYTFWQE